MASFSLAITSGWLLKARWSSSSRSLSILTRFLPPSLLAMASLIIAPHRCVKAYMDRRSSSSSRSLASWSALLAAAPALLAAGDEPRDQDEDPGVELPR